MNDVSIRSVQLRQRSQRGIGSNMAKRALLAVFERIAVGSLTVYDGDETLHFTGTEDLNHPHARIHVNDHRVYQQILAGGALGSGESFIQGQWSSPDLPEVIRLFTANMSVLQSMNASRSLWMKLGLKLAHFFNRNTLAGSRKNISAHYDLGNDFFSLFLDETMMYSAAVYPSPDASLEQAAAHKLDLLCDQLQLTAEDHLLEIGTGWGGMAVHAARRHGCKVTTTTISQEQYEYALQRVKEEGLEDQVTVLCDDYRDLTGQYDKLVSIEMIEAVGHRFYQNYFNKCSSLLKPNGLMVIQAITIADQRYDQASKSVDFIQKYIFPGGSLPSVEVISQHIAQDTDMQIVHLRDITEDYANTLADWRERFFNELDTVKAQGFDENFIRMWDFYLSYCEGGFRERVISTVQLAFAKPGYRFV